MKRSRQWGAWAAMVCGVAAALAVSHPSFSKEKAAKAPPETASGVAMQNRSEDVELVAAGDTIRGTLVIPGSAKPMPLVLILAGSGPTDRDGNSGVIPGKNNCLKMLADSLLEHGIASIRYDKRGIAASRGAMKSEADLRITTYSDDAVKWMQQYRHDARFTTLTLLGHSEGALVATLAVKQEKPDALILLSGAGRPARALIHEQLKHSISADLVKKSDAIMDTLIMGKDVADVPPILMALYRPSVQAYMRSWLALDPAAELKEVKVPTMVAWGPSDIQVSRADFDLLCGARGGIKKVLVPSMNHILKATLDDPMAQLSVYSDSTIGLAPGLSESIIQFVRSVKRS